MSVRPPELGGWRGVLFLHESDLLEGLLAVGFGAVSRSIRRRERVLDEGELGDD